LATNRIFTQGENKMHTDKIIELMNLSFLTGLDYATQMSTEEKENVYQNFKNNANFLIEVIK